MIGLLLGIAVLAAVVAAGVRRWQRSRAQGRRPGATIHRPVAVSRFDEIDAAVQGRACWCGGLFVASGETSRRIGERRFRIVRLVCNQCEREELTYFDVTAVFH
ncbi:MAG TPA: hypothetical protein VN812_21720 [Candidatus Acidoferrales bacterium]|nr:hypothetical protein [Candidatus Acidoferrales bacterium]